MSKSNDNFDKEEHRHLSLRIYKEIKNNYNNGNNNTINCLDYVEIPKSFMNDHNDNNLYDLLMYESYKNKFDDNKMDCNIDFDKKYTFPLRYINDIFKSMAKLRGEDDVIGENKINVYISVLANLYAYFILRDNLSAKSFLSKKIKDNNVSNFRDDFYYIMKNVTFTDLSEKVLNSIDYNFNRHSKIMIFTSLPWPYRLLCTPVLDKRVGRTQMEESKTLGNGSLNVYVRIQKNTME